MKLVIAREGGFAGNIGKLPQGERDWSELSDQQRKTVMALVEEAPAIAADLAKDRFTYHIKLEDADKVISVRVPESRMPPDLATIARR